VELEENWTLARNTEAPNPMKDCLDMATPVVTKVKVQRPYVIDVTFEDGQRRSIDLEWMLSGEVFGPLRDPALFAQATVDPLWRNVVWPNGADLDPEFLYGGTFRKRQAS
jgi:hypothetical protein